MTRREAYELMQQGTVAGIFLSQGAAQEIAIVLYDAMRTAGELPLSPDADLAKRIDNVSEGAQRDSADLHQRVKFLEAYFRDEDGDFIPHSGHMFADHRVVNAFVTRLDVIEKRLGPPANMSGGWALLTDVEMSQAIARMETEIAEFRKNNAEAAKAIAHVECKAITTRLDRMQEEINLALSSVYGQINSLRKGLANVNAQWHNIRAKFTALLSSAGD